MRSSKRDKLQKRNFMAKFPQCYRNYKPNFKAIGQKKVAWAELKVFKPQKCQNLKRQRPKDLPQADYVLVAFKIFLVFPFKMWTLEKVFDAQKLLGPKMAILALFWGFLTRSAEFSEGQMKNFNIAECSPCHRRYANYFQKSFYLQKLEMN